MRVSGLLARIIANSKGEPALEAEFNGFRASAPAGTSIGKKEAIAFRKSVDECVDLINHTPLNLEISRFDDLRKIEDIFFSLGGNPVLACELSVLKALSSGNVFRFMTSHPQMPTPLGKCIGGGAHSRGVGPDFQEFLTLVPKARSFFEASNANLLMHTKVRELLGRGDERFGHMTDLEGGWETSLGVVECLEIMSTASRSVSNTLDFDIKIGVDVAASNFFKDGHYCYKNFSHEKRTRILSPKDQIAIIEWMIDRFKLYYVEDPLDQEDFPGFSQINQHKALICGDDLTCTNPSLISKAIKEASINSVIIKPNQVGSLIKTKEAVDLAKKHGLVAAISHRSGETMDTWLSHLAVGFDLPLIKCGIVGPERTAKINELLDIEKELLFKA